MASETVSQQLENSRGLRVTLWSQLFSGRRGRILRENLTAYLFLAPGLLIIFVFGMFPILYAGYVSLHNWRIRQGEYRGLQNYVNAMGDVAYLFFVLIVLTLLGVAIYTAVKSAQSARERELPFYLPALFLAPAAVIAFGLGQLLLSIISFFMQEPAIQAGHANRMGSVPLGIAALVMGLGGNWWLDRWQHGRFGKTPHSLLPSFGTPALTFVASTAVALVIGAFVYNHLLNLEQLERSIALIRMRYLGQAILALVLAYLVWTWGMRQESNLKLAAGIGGGAGLIGASYYLMDIWPAVSQGADPKFYLSLKVTIFYSIGTVPIQLAIAMILAYLLFQDIRFKGFFRVVFFIPYIAPAVAAAGIFQALFSLRPTGFINRFFTGGGARPEAALLWLKEPNPALAVLGQAVGIESAANWNFGPSLALLVIILFNIWNFVGYNIVIFLAGLGNIPRALYEAAEIDGAGPWILFRHITIPLLSPTTFFLTVISVIGTFKAFSHVWVLRETAALGTTDTVSIYFFETFFRGARFGYATTMAMVLFVIILLLTLIQNRIAADKVFYE